MLETIRSKMMEEFSKKTETTEKFEEAYLKMLKENE
jgi:hypothetical protein